MHATEEITPSCGKPRVGLIAGQGDLPCRLIARWREQGVSPIVVGLKGITPDSLSDLTDDVTFFAIGQAGHILEHLKDQGAQSVVLAGALKRPNFWALRTDSYGFGILLRLLSRLVLRRMGDDSLLKFIRHEIEKFGLTLIGAHEVLPDILSPAGVLGTVSPTEGEWIRMEQGVLAAKRHGADDKGQSVVVDAQGTIYYETETGTNALIGACAGQETPILVKMSKPQQDLALDMPTIGPVTIENLHKAGFRGVAVEAGRTLILDRARVIAMCNAYGLFVMGIEEHGV